MLKNTLLLSVIVLCVGTLAIGQPDSTLYSNGIPMVDEDSVENIIPPDQDPKKQRVRVPEEKIPARVSKVLRSDNYKGWEKTGLYLDKNTRLYIVTVPYADGFRIFGLDQYGKPVTYDEVSELDDQNKN
jgi:hypothetical protein